MSELEYKKPQSKYGGAVFSALVLGYVLFSAIFGLITGIDGVRGTDIAIYIGYLASPLASLIVACLFFVQTKMPVKEMLPVKTAPKYYGYALLALFGLMFSLSQVNPYIVMLLQRLGYVPREGYLPSIEGWNILPAIIFIAVIPAVCEEVMFRGLIIFNAEQGAGTVRSVFIAGLCFSLFHGSVEQTVYQFVCGCVFALIALRSRSVAPTVIIHFLNNAVILILTACGAVAADGMLNAPLWVNILITVLSALSLVGATVLLALDKSEIKQRQEGGVKDFFICAALGLGVMTLVWILGLFGL